MSIEKISETLVGVQIEVGRQAEELKGIHKTMDSMGADIKEIKNSMVGDVKSSNKIYKGWIFRLAMFILGAGSIAGGANAVASIMADNPQPPAIEQVEK